MLAENLVVNAACDLGAVGDGSYDALTGDVGERVAAPHDECAGGGGNDVADRHDGQVHERAHDAAVDEPVDGFHESAVRAAHLDALGAVQGVLLWVCGSGFVMGARPGR